MRRQHQDVGPCHQRGGLRGAEPARQRDAVAQPGARDLVPEPLHLAVAGQRGGPGPIAQAGAAERGQQFRHALAITQPAEQQDAAGARRARRAGRRGRDAVMDHVHPLAWDADRADRPVGPGLPQHDNGGRATEHRRDPALPEAGQRRVERVIAAAMQVQHERDAQRRGQPADDQLPGRAAALGQVGVDPGELSGRP